MVAPAAVDFQIGPQPTLKLKSGFFQEPHRTLIVRDTGRFHPVQCKRAKCVAFNHIYSFAHIPLSGKALRPSSSR